MCFQSFNITLIFLVASDFITFQLSDYSRYRKKEKSFYYIYVYLYLYIYIYI